MPIAITTTYETLRSLSVIAVVHNADRLKQQIFDKQHTPPAVLADIITKMHSLKIRCDPQYYRQAKMSDHDSRLYLLNNRHGLKDYCANLTSLDLSCFTALPPNELIFIVQNIPQIVSLDLRSTRCSDKVLGSIGMHCPNLETLDVSRNPNMFIYIRSRCQSFEGVTDAGVKSLCTDKNGNCRGLKISNLNVSGTSVTATGVLYAMNNLPFLVDFGCLNIHKFLQVIRDKWKPTEERCRAFRSLVCPDYCFASRETVISMFEILPNLFKLSLVLRWGNDLDALGLYSNLRVLELRCFAGHDEFRLDSVARVFPNLEELTLNVGYFDANEVFTVQEPFRRLRRVTTIVANTITARQILFLLTHSPCLESIKFDYCHNLTDEVVRTLVAVNPLRSLREIYMDKCNGITVRSLIAFAENCEGLCFLNVSSCGNISRNDLLYARAYSKINRLRAVIKAYGYYADECGEKGYAIVC